jgi:hypothetical protein
MKKLFFIFSTSLMITLLSCQKENNLDTVSAKWVVGDLGKSDTTLAVKASATGEMLFKMTNYSLCPAFGVGLTVKVNDVVVLQENLTEQDTTGRTFVVKTNDNVVVQTKLVGTNVKINCIRLGSADCLLNE